MEVQNNVFQRSKEEASIYAGEVSEGYVEDWSVSCDLKDKYKLPAGKVERQYSGLKEEYVQKKVGGAC